MSNSITGSPHDAMPVLMADGGVRTLRYGVPQNIYENMIFWQDGTAADNNWLP